MCYLMTSSAAASGVLEAMTECGPTEMRLEWLLSVAIVQH